MFVPSSLTCPAYFASDYRNISLTNLLKQYPVLSISFYFSWMASLWHLKHSSFSVSVPVALAFTEITIFFFKRTRMVQHALQIPTLIAGGLVFLLSIQLLLLQTTELGHPCSTVHLELVSLVAMYTSSAARQGIRSSKCVCIIFVKPFILTKYHKLHICFI